MGHLSPYADAAIKMFGLSGATRYHRNDALQSILGVNAGLIGDVSRFRSAMTSGDTKAIMSKGLAFAPFSGLLQMGHHLYFGPPQQQ